MLCSPLRTLWESIDPSLKTLGQCWPNIPLEDSVDKAHKSQRYTELDADVKQKDWKTTEKCGAEVLEPHPP